MSTHSHDEPPVFRSGGGDSGGARYGFDGRRFFLIGALLVAVTVVVAFVSAWFFCRVEPPSGHCAVMVRRDGTDIPANDIIATKPGQKGIQLEPLSEGRYFFNPVNWSWKIEPLVNIEQGQVGVLIRQFGVRPPAGQYIVRQKEPDGTMQRGIIDEPLRPGTYRLNSYAYEVEKHPAVKIDAGEVGVLTLRYGPEPKKPNTILVGAGERGVQPQAMRPGTYYLNPYISRVDIVGVQSHKTEFEISFLSRDGFRFPVKGAVEWAIDELRAPEVFVLIGDEEDIVHKVVLRAALSMSRIQGSKYASAEVIGGTVRKTFQDEFFTHITAEGQKKGVLIKAALISEIEPPDKIAQPIRDRQIAVQTRTKYENEILRAKSDALVAAQKKTQDQRTRVVAAETSRTNAVQQAMKDQQVQLIGAKRDLDVATKDLETAEKQALAIVSLGQGDADVVTYSRTAEASALQAAMAPFGSGATYARYLYLTKLAPNIETILSNTDGLLAEPLRALSQPDPGKAGGPPAATAGGAK